MNQQPPNIFDNCFSDELSRGSCSGNSIYENQMAEQTQSSSRQKADHLRQVRDQVKMDFDAVDRIAQDVNELNQIMDDLSRIIEGEAELVESIEEHIEKTTQDVLSASNQLKKAEKMKNAKYPVAAAAVGGLAVGGPAGIFAGSAAVGIIGTVGGAFAGLYSGKIFKRKVESESKTEV